jgi:hypothetical protein
MSWMRRFAEILQRSETRLAAARGWLAQIWALIMSPRAFRRLLKDKPLQTELRWKLRLTEALLRLAITQRANAIVPPPLTPTRPNLRRLPGGIFLPADPLGPAYVARFRLSAQPSRWAIQPPVSVPQTRQPQHPAALLHRLLACQDGLDRFEKLAWLEAKRKRRRPALALAAREDLISPRSRGERPFGAEGGVRAAPPKPPPRVPRTSPARGGGLTAAPPPRRGGAPNPPRLRPRRTGGRMISTFPSCRRPRGSAR